MSFRLEISEKILEVASKLAELEGVSLEEWILSALEDKIRSESSDDDESARPQ